MNPDERLGSGASPELTFETLKAHEFFAETNFEYLLQTESPLLEIFLELDEKECQSYEEMPEDLFLSDEWKEEQAAFTERIQGIARNQPLPVV